MARRSFELSTTVPGTPSAVIDLLSDLGRHHDLHPFLVSAEVVSEGASHRGPWLDWSVVEEPVLGPMRYRIRFRARITRTSATSMESRVRALPGCRLRGIIQATSTVDGQTLVTESTAATAPFPLVGHLARQARAAHARTFAGLPGALVG